MKWLLVAILCTLTLRADPYIDYTNQGLTNLKNYIDGAILYENMKFADEFANYNALVVDTSAAMIAMSNIDFFKHDGFSAGMGLATIHTGYGNGNAYALGVQYGMGEVMMNIKGSYKGSGEFIIGSGFVIGF